MAAAEMGREMRATFNEGQGLGVSQGVPMGMEMALGLRPMSKEQERCLKGLHARASRQRRVQGQARARSALLGLAGVFMVASFSAWSLLG